ncbi:MAG: hypothetical protein CMJ46_07930 [Planctomyces sp.]|nr:hypothetical protein [Planctomyces sp.]
MPFNLSWTTLSNRLMQSRCIRRSNRRDHGAAPLLECLEERVLLSAEGFVYEAGTYTDRDFVPQLDAYDVATDAEGNTYALINNPGNQFVDFDPGPDVVEQPPQFFQHLVKIDPEGNFLWIRSHVRPPGYWTKPLFKSLAVDDSGFAYVNFYSTDEQVLKYDGDGNLVDTFQFYGHPTDYDYPRGLSFHGHDMIVDSEGNIFLSADFSGIWLVQQNGEEVVYETASDTGYDGVVVKLNSSGEVQWVKQFPISENLSGGSAHPVDISLAFGKDEELILFGNYQGSIDFQVENGGDIRSGVERRDMFLAKLSGDGVLEWGRTLNGTNQEYATDVAVNDEGDIFVSGSFKGNLDLDPSTSTWMLTTAQPDDRAGFIARYSSDGELVWGGSINDVEGFTTIESLDLTAEGNVVVAANLWGSADLDIGPGTDLFQINDRETAIISYDPDGNLLWRGKLEDTVKLWSPRTVNSANTLVANPDGSITVGGTFRGWADFDIGPGRNIVSTDLPTGHASHNAYVWNISADDIRGLERNQSYAADFDFGLPSTLNFTNVTATSIVTHQGEKQLQFNNSGNTGLSAALWNSNEPLPSTFELSAEVTSLSGPNRWQDGFLIFDYKNENDFKYAGMFTGQNQWVIGHYQGHFGSRLAQVDWDDTGRMIHSDMAYTLHARIDGNRVYLSVDGEFIAAADFSGPLNNGAVGMAAAHAVTTFDNFLAGEKVDQGAPSSLPYHEDFQDGIANQLQFHQPQLWSVQSNGSANYLQIDAAGNKGLGLATVDAEWPMPNNYEMSAVVTSISGANRWFDGFLIFDYESENDFKYAGMFTGQNQWVIGHFQGDWGNRFAQEDLDDVGLKINANTPNLLHLTINDNVAELRVDGILTVAAAFPDGIHNGTVGVAALNAVTSFDNLKVDVEIPHGKPLPLPHDDSFNEGTADQFHYTKADRWAVVNPMGAHLLRVNTSNGGGNGIAYLPIDNPESKEIVISADVRSNPTTNGWNNGLLIFDYKNEQDFKYAGFFTGQNQWVMGHYQGDWNSHSNVVDWDESGRSIEFKQFYHLELRLKGHAAMLSVDGEQVLVSGFHRNIPKGPVGLAAANAFTWFDNFQVAFAEPLSAPTADGLFANWDEEQEPLLI